MSNSIDASGTWRLYGVQEPKEWHLRFKEINGIKVKIKGGDLPMFNHMPSLIILDLSNLNTQNVRKMHSMFRDCWNLSKIDIRHFDMTKVYAIEAMFHGCRSLFEINLNKEARQRINSRPEIGTIYIFKGCQSLSSLPDIFSKNKFGKANGDADGCINTLNQ